MRRVRIAAHRPGRSVSIDAIDIVRLDQGRYAQDWDLNTLSAVLATLHQV